MNECLDETCNYDIFLDFNLNFECIIIFSFKLNAIKFLV